MFGELRILLFGCFRSTHGWMGMDVWANVRLYNAILVRRSWSVEKDVQGVTWNIRENDIIRQHVSESRCWTQLQRFCVSSVLGKKASTVEESWGAGANRPGRRPPPHWTGRGPANESIMFGEWSILLFFCFRVCFSFCFLRSVHAFMWMDVWVNVFTMPFLCADSGPWRKMSRAWPPMSAIMTSLGSTCPNHQESAWGAAEATQEKVVVKVVRKGIVVVKCWSMRWTHVQVFSVSTVLGEKAFDVEQSWGASWKPLAAARHHVGQEEHK